jgi:peptidoglycan/xylan/chitin deacetylase (PgdA/CDA1 family)
MAGRSALRLCAVSIDLDEIGCYSAIHGLPDLPGEAAHAVYRRALPRLLSLLEKLSIPATLFACGRDLDDSAAASCLRAAAQAGYEIANHSQDHLYDLTRRPRSEMHAQVLDGIRSIERATGQAPSGFRAPGYTINDELFSVLGELGVSYDSSVFPCPLYYAGKTAAIGHYRARGRPTHSVIDDPRVLRAPAEPYRIDRPYYRRGNGILEFPIGVTRDWTGRLPYIGTYIALAGRAGARALTRLIAGRSLVNLELHGIDAADAQDDGLQALLVPQQPDLHRSARDKLDNLTSALTTLRDEGYEFVTLRDAAQVFGAVYSQ